MADAYYPKDPRKITEARALSAKLMKSPRAVQYCDGHELDDDWLPDPTKLHHGKPVTHFLSKVMCLMFHLPLEAQHERFITWLGQNWEDLKTQTKHKVVERMDEFLATYGADPELFTPLFQHYYEGRMDYENLSGTDARMLLNFLRTFPRFALHYFTSTMPMAEAKQLRALRPARVFPPFETKERKQGSRGSTKMSTHPETFAHQLALWMLHPDRIGEYAIEHRNPKQHMLLLPGTKSTNVAAQQYLYFLSVPDLFDLIAKHPKHKQPLIWEALDERILQLVLDFWFHPFSRSNQIEDYEKMLHTRLNFVKEAIEEAHDEYGQALEKYGGDYDVEIDEGSESYDSSVEGKERFRKRKVRTVAADEARLYALREMDPDDIEYRAAAALETRQYDDK